jgi:hypothetical protein
LGASSRTGPQQTGKCDQKNEQKRGSFRQQWFHGNTVSSEPGELTSVDLYKLLGRRGCRNEYSSDAGVQLEMTRVDGGLLIRPLKREYTLAELLEENEPENMHGETDWGQATGRETW